MRHVKVVVASFALLALAGCTTEANAPFGQSSTRAATTGSSAAPTTLSSTTGTTTGSTSGSQPMPPPPQTSAAPLEGGPTEVPPTQVDSGALGYQGQAWTSADARTIRLNGSEGGCDRVRAEVTAQSGDQVLITLVTTKYTDVAAACTADLRDVPLNVTLDAPLGSRRITLETREETP
ncbi:hypothetical protein ACIGNX_03135 [Actinosynnema sp. NPDC053489]|uniref:hypothetical protein n=1 Tax=Actinosynnema sp. NPDC053489 TaxID=3363916 RepID=UPI0037C82040